MTTEARPTIAVIGGTGDLGSGIAWQLVKAGYKVTIGSRGTEKAEKAAAALAERSGVKVDGFENSVAASTCDVVIMTVPFASHQSTLETIKPSLEGKIFVDATVPLVPPKVARVQLPEGGSVAKQSQAYLGEDVRVVSAFQNIAADHLQADELHADNCDVLVSGNDPEAREVVVKLTEAMGLNAWHAGPIDNSVVAEALTSVLIFLNKRYKLNGSGIHITGSKAAAE